MLSCNSRTNTSFKANGLIAKVPSPLLRWELSSCPRRLIKTLVSRKLIRTRIYPSLFLVRFRQSSKAHQDSRLKDLISSRLKAMSLVSNKWCLDICPSKWNRTSLIVCPNNLEDTPRKDSNNYQIKSLSIHKICIRSIKILIISTRQTDICMRDKRLWTSKLTCTINKDLCQVTMFLHNCVLQCTVRDMTWCTWVLPTFEQCTTTGRAIRCTTTKCETITWGLLT